MAGRPPSSGWSFLRDHPGLRGLIRHRIDSRKLTLVEVGAATDIRPDSLTKFLNGKRGTLSDYKVVILCRFLKIDLELEITLSDEIGASTPVS